MTDEEMKAAELGDEVLEHHGILGQKWGIRRYQNEDGSLTEAGKRRYSREVAKEQRVARSIEKSERRMRIKEAKAAGKNMVEDAKTQVKQAKNEEAKAKLDSAQASPKFTIVRYLQELWRLQPS